MYKYDIENEYKGGVLDTILYIFFGVITFGLYFIFLHFAEKKRAKIEKEYYECQDCGLRMNKSIFKHEIQEEIKEERNEEEVREIREIGLKETDMSTWKQEREEAVKKKRENSENNE